MLIKKIIFLFIGLVLLGLLGFTIVQSYDAKNNYKNLSGKLEKLTYKKVYLAQSTDEKSIEKLTKSVNSSKLSKENEKTLKRNLDQLRIKLAKQEQVNQLFEKTAVSQDQLTTVAIKDDAAPNKIELSPLPDDSFKNQLQKAVDNASSQIETFNKLKAELTSVQENSSETAENLEASLKKFKAQIDQVLNQNSKKALTDQISKLESSLIAKASTSQLANKKIIALTFDDGPSSAHTPALLDSLKAAGVKATFFVLGNNAAANPAILKREAAEGHEIASHTVDHAQLTKLPQASQTQEIESAAATIKSITGQDHPFYRPPYGAYNDTTLKASSRSPILWSNDTEDWRRMNSAADTAAAIANPHDGEIILMHDIHGQSVAAVPQIILSLQAQGFTFVTVSQLIEARYGEIKPSTVYTGK